ncbi:glycosyltransferase family 2 protein [Rhodobacteraceae bacterium RKSG542]|uniref:glycosyltransferase family 2 protein n=1 Tax=Pseudovibrio flavus TaxID=2529854 RepID=UPI0012BBE93B|nr:glycosyltransferase family 2 protein [Pseudovibrio flavus]MTI17323.1 glycosyltransferase family 2 protein [Pseudovibrio flavus]
MAVEPNNNSPFLSVVIPAKDEQDNIISLVDEIGSALDDRAFEVLVVDDGSTDQTQQVLIDKARDVPWLRCFHHQKSCGQSCSIRTGLRHAKGEIVVTIDGDGQNDPAYIPDLIAALDAGGAEVGIAAGQRVGRKASVFKRYASKAANAIRGSLLRDGTRDSGCGLKAVRRDVFLALPYFDSWHRFMPALVIREGFKVVHVDVVDRERRFGNSKYGIVGRALEGALDLVGVWWLIKRRRTLPDVTQVTAAQETDWHKEPAV